MIHAKNLEYILLVLFMLHSFSLYKLINALGIKCISMRPEKDNLKANDSSCFQFSLIFSYIHKWYLYFVLVSVSLLL